MAKKETKLTQSQIVNIEKEIRRYVRCGPKDNGGFRKDLSEADKKRCKELLKQLGRTALKMDESIVVPGHIPHEQKQANRRD